MDKDMNNAQAMSDSDNTVVGVYDNYDDAKAAADALVAAGFTWNNVQINTDTDSVAKSDGSGDSDRSGSGGIGNFFRRLFGEDNSQDHDIYAESVRRGHHVLTVDGISQNEVDRASDIMSQYNAVDIDERVGHWRNQGWSGYDSSAPRYTNDEIAADRDSYLSARRGASSSDAGSGTSSEEARIPVVEENIQVGKRQVEGGGVRVFTRVREKPVNESVTLREEHVKVERRPVDKSVAEADMNAFKEGSIEMREKAEKAVVGKSARVVEEVVVGKETTERTEQINDTVRRTDVEIEKLDASDSSRGATTMTGDDSDFRNHWQTNFGASGGRYEDYAPAYSYGSSMASSDRYRDAQWEEVEPQWRSDWESRYPNSRWDKVKDAVRYGSQSSSRKGR